MLTPEEKIELVKLDEERARRAHYNKLKAYYPEDGPLRRELYVKHMQFFAAGPTFIERLMMAANRVGKTEGVGGYEMTLHLTGRYPPWWNGRRFDRAIDAWVGGDTTETVRDIVQLKLLGKLEDIGSGLIPKDAIVSFSRKKGIADAVDTLVVKHASGQLSFLAFKSYDQGRESWQGTKKDVIWLDEEPPIDIYTEALLRTTSTTGKHEDNGLMILTFTPLSGMSETVMAFLPNGQISETQEGSKFVVMATWDDAPHLSEETKAILWKALPPHQRDARTKGVPQLGSGAIYPVPETEVLVDDFPIPEHWPRFFAMDVGWKRTAVGWYAHDRENDIIYKYGEHYRGEAEPSVHADAIRARGEWIPGVIDPAARGRSQHDGTQLYEKYIDLGLDLDLAKNAVESGILEVWQRLSSGRLKIFRSCQYWLAEFRLYRRDDKGRIVKEFDHAMDETRYAVMSGLDRAKVKPQEKKPEVDPWETGFGSEASGWMG
jgi:phage terminase large subunit-like protein